MAPHSTLLTLETAHDILRRSEKCLRRSNDTSDFSNLATEQAPLAAGGGGGGRRAVSHGHVADLELLAVPARAGVLVIR